MSLLRIQMLAANWRRRRGWGSSTFWLRHSFVIPHSDFVITNYSYPYNM